MLFWFELKKILLAPMLLVFIALCFGFNLLIVIPGAFYYDYADYVAVVSRTTGYKLGAEFDDRIGELESSEFRDYLQEDTQGITDVFDDYDTAYIADAYINKLGLSGYISEAMRSKYVALQSAVDVKASSDESLTLYFASATGYKHNELYRNVMIFLLLECALLAALIVQLSLGYEHTNRTTHTIYAAKMGRKILRHKLFASLTATMTAFAVIIGLTLTVYFALNDYGNIWSSSVSSVFHYIDDMLAGSRPFVTWRSYTVLTYLLTVLGISALLSLCFGLMSFVIGTWIKNSYIGFLIFIIFNACCLVFAFVFSGKLPAYFAMLTPVWLWLKQPFWFTDGGTDILWQNFETLGACVSLVLLTGLCVFSAIMFRKRDIV